MTGQVIVLQVGKGTPLLVPGDGIGVGFDANGVVRLTFADEAARNVLLAYLKRAGGGDAE